MPVVLQTILLLTLSNVFMTFAWYGHLGGDGKSTWSVLEYVADLKNRPWILAVVVSWGIAFVEYLFQVPANRIGKSVFNLAQLKILQEVLSLLVFGVMAVFYWKQKVSLNFLWASLCIMGAVFFVFRKDDLPTATPPGLAQPGQAQESPRGESS